MAKRQRVNVVQEVEDSEFELDTGDIIVGVILMIVIPVGVYIGLSVINYPVSGKRQVSYEQTLAIKEKKENRKPPRMDREEVRNKLKRIDRLIDEHVPRFRNFRMKEENAPAAQHYYSCAQKCLGAAEADLKHLKKSVVRNPDLGSDADRIEDKILSRLQDVEQIRVELNKERVFVSNK